MAIMYCFNFFCFVVYLKSFASSKTRAEFDLSGKHFSDLNISTCLALTFHQGTFSEPT